MRWTDGHTDGVRSVNRPPRGRTT